MNRDVATLIAAMECGPCMCHHASTPQPKPRAEVTAKEPPPQRTSWLSKLLPIKTLAAVLFRLN